MSSLLPFNFGHRTAYFAVEVTIHEIQDVPLISGRFQAKWRVRNPHQYSAHLSYTGGGSSGTSTPAGSQLAKLFHKDNQEGSDKQNDRHEDNHSVHSRQDDASSSIHDDHEEHTASSSNFLSGIFNRRQRKDSQHPSSHHHSGEASGRASLDTEQSISSRKNAAVARSRGVQQGHNQHHTDPVSGSGIPSNFHAEPRGATEWEEVDEHSVKWGRTFHSGIRVAIDKTKAGAQQPHSSSVDSAHDSKALRSRSSHRDLRLQEDKEEQAVWGLLGNSELKVTIRQDVQTDSHSSSDPAPLGVVVLNLAEYAPCPQTAAHTHLPHQHHSHDHHHSHHQHHHHHHHHQHQHQHQQNQHTQSNQHTQHSHHSASSMPPALPQLRRKETRRYLLQESKTNASLQLSIKVTHIGGSREYTVPPIRRGLVIGGLRGESDQLLKSSQGNDSESEQGNSKDGSKALLREPSSASIRQFADRKNQMESSTLDKLAAGSNSTRIPSKNLKNGGSKKSRYISHHSSSTAPVSSWNAQSVSGKGRKRAQLQSLAFAFSGSGNWERDPSDVIDAIFAAHATADGKSASEAKKSRAKSSGLSTGSMQRSSSQYSHLSTSTHGNDKNSIASRRQSGGSVIKPLQTKSLSSSPCTSLAQLSPIKRLRPNTTASVGSSSPAPPSPSARQEAKEGESGNANPERSVQRIKWDTRKSDVDPAPDASSSAMAGTSDSLGLRRRASSDALSSRGDSQRNTSTSGCSPASSSPLQRRSALTKENDEISFSGSTSDALSPSASTVMQDEATPMPSRVTSVALAKFRQGTLAGKGDDGADDDRSETGDTVVGQDSRPGQIKKKKSKGLIGIRPSDAEKMGFKGAGWKSSGLRVGFALADDDKGERDRRAKSSAPAIYERDESPKGTRDEEDEAQWKQERRSPPSPQGNGGKEVAYGEEPDSPVLALKASLSPYVEARLGRPRSKVGLRSTSVGSTPKGFARSSMETVSAFTTSATGGPGPHVVQGQDPLPSRINASEKRNKDVPALIPGAAPTKYAPESGDAGENVVDDDSRRGSAATSSGTSGQASSSEQHDGEIEKGESGPASTLAPVPVWADAQTELEAHFDKRAVYALLSPPPLPGTKSYFSKDTASAVAGSSAAAGRRSPESSLHSGVAVGRGRERGLSITSGASTARSTLLDRPDGVPAPAAYVIRQMEEQEQEMRREQQKRREEGSPQSKKKEKENGKKEKENGKKEKEKKSWMTRG